MKWLPRKGSKKRSLAAKNPSSSLISPSQLIKLAICLILTGVFLSGNVSKFRSKIFASDSTEKSSTEIDDMAANISVKISGGGFLGSGFIVLQEQERYTVITNQHVLRAGKAPYSIQTIDGKIYLAEVVHSSSAVESQYDLAVLEFTTDNTYSTAKIGSSLYLEVGEPIYAAGFPYTELPVEERIPAIFEQPEVSEIDGFELKVGRIAMILNQALEEGYQIGYTNDVKKGMSGGPLLNYRGEVVGVNGKHAYPLWESTELYQDGSQPCPALQKLITRSSLAIPIEKIVKLTSRLESLRLAVNTKKASQESDWLNKNSKLVAEMQAEAEATNKSCEKYENNSQNNY